MRRWSTETLICELDTPDLDLTTLTQIYISIDDGRSGVKEWGISRITVDNENKELSLTLTQAETGAFKTGIAQVQANMLTSDGARIETEYSEIEIYDSLKEGVIE